MKTGSASYGKAIAAAFVVTLVLSFVVMQFRPEAMAVFGSKEPAHINTADVGIADVESGFMKEMEIFSDIGENFGIE